MDSLRTLLLARTFTVVLDPDRVASAATRPARNSDVDRFEDELAQLGFVMSLDLAMTVRRFPHQAIQELRQWMIGTLTRPLAALPHVPLFAAMPPTAPDDPYAVYARRVMTWLATRAEHPCPWCARRSAVGALDPCGHLVCRDCWGGGSFAGCPICHRRVTPDDPFIVPLRGALPLAADQQILRHDGELRLLQLAFDVHAVARGRFERLIGRPAPLAIDERAELETVIDAVGPRAAAWLPARIPVAATRAIAVARLWLVAGDRSEMARATRAHLGGATDVLRVATVLMGGDPALAAPSRLRSVGRGLRRAVLEALDALPAEQVVQDMRRHAGRWKRVGEQLHPFERAAQLPSAALAFAVLRGTELAGATFTAQLPETAGVAIAARAEVEPTGRAVEAALHRGDPRAAAALLATRPNELIRRADHVLRLAAAEPYRAVVAEVLAAFRRALPRVEPDALLVLAAHIAQRGQPWRERVLRPTNDPRRAWVMPDARPPLPAEIIAAVVAAVRGELLARAEARPRFARAVVDRELAELALPGARVVGWPRGSELALPASGPLRLALAWEEPPAHVGLAAEGYDAAWRGVARQVATPRPGGGVELVLDVDALRARGVAHLVVAITGAPRTSTLELGAHRFPVPGRAAVAVPLAIDLGTRRARWLDLRLAERHALRATLARFGHDAAALAAARARPTLWEVAAIHATARANVVYARDANRIITSYRRRDGEPTSARLARLLAGEHDGVVAAIPPADAPTWVALRRADVELPTGSAGYVLDASDLATTAAPGGPTPGPSGGPTSDRALARVTARALVDELVPL